MSSLQYAASCICALGVSLALPPTSARAAVTANGVGKPQFDALVASCRQNAWFESQVWQVVNTKNIVLNLVNEQDVWVDAWCSNKVDIFDILRHPKVPGAKQSSQCELLVHVLWENYLKACGDDYETAHDGALTKEGNFRIHGGLGTIPEDNRNSVVLRTRDDENERICSEWGKYNGGGIDGKDTYVPLPEEVSEEDVHLISQVSLSGGRNRYTLAVNALDPNTETLQLPSIYGGGEIQITGFSCTIVIETKPRTPQPLPTPLSTQSLTPVPAEVDAFHIIKVLSLTGSAPPIPLPAPYNSTGLNSLTLDPLGTADGSYNTENGAFEFTYTGKITNDLYPRESPLRFFTMVTGEWFPGQGIIEARTFGALIDGELSGEQWSHDGE